MSSSFQKWDLCVSLLFAHVLEMGTPTLKAHLNTLQEADAYPLRGVCSHLTHVLFDAETQLLQATGRRAWCGRHCPCSLPKPVVQRVEFRTVRSPLLTATSPVAWRSCVSAPSSTCVKRQQTTRRWWAPNSCSAFRCALSVGRGGANFEHMRK